MRAWLIVALILGAQSTGAYGQQRIIGGMTWMSGFPPTWDAGSPKVVSDGLFYYAVICGYYGSSSNCSIARRRGLEEWQVVGHRVFTSIQPALMVIDRKGRLNVFFNDPYIHHFRFDHPAVDLDTWTHVPIPFSTPAGYMTAGYDSGSDTIMLAFSETTTWRMQFGVKFTDANNWTVSPLPAAVDGTMLLYPRVLRASGRFYVMAGEHVTNAINASYVGALMFESTSSTGPWSTRVLHRVTGNNLGIPYQNWVLANDLQKDASGRVRAMLHITESASGHADAHNGLYILREEDGFLPRLIAPASVGLEDGFTLDVDPTGVHMAFARSQVPHYYPGQSAPYAYTGDIVTFRSGDNGATWGPQVSQVDSAVNPVIVQPRSGSMLGGNFVPIIYSDEVTHAGPWDSVWFFGVQSQISNSATRYDYSFTESDGSAFYVRAYEEAGSGRYYYYFYDYALDGAFSLTYTYTAGTYCKAYITNSTGAYKYYDSDGYLAQSGTPAVIRYTVDDGIQRIHLRRLCATRPATVTNLRIQPPGN